MYMSINLLFYILSLSPFSYSLTLSLISTRLDIYFGIYLSISPPPLHLSCPLFNLSITFLRGIPLKVFSLPLLLLLPSLFSRHVILKSLNRAESPWCKLFVSQNTKSAGIINCLADTFLEALDLFSPWIEEERDEAVWKIFLRKYYYFWKLFKGDFNLKTELFHML